MERKKTPGRTCRPADRRPDDTARGNQPRSMNLGVLAASPIAVTATTTTSPRTKPVPQARASRNANKTGPFASKTGSPTGRQAIALGEVARFLTTLRLARAGTVQAAWVAVAFHLIRLQTREAGRKIARREVSGAAAAPIAPLAQLDRASVYGTEGCRFESCKVRLFSTGVTASGVFARWQFRQLERF